MYEKIRRLSETEPPAAEVRPRFRIGVEGTPERVVVARHVHDFDELVELPTFGEGHHQQVRLRMMQGIEQSRGSSSVMSSSSSRPVKLSRWARRVSAGLVYLDGGTVPIAESLNSVTKGPQKDHLLTVDTPGKEILGELPFRPGEQ